MESQESNKYIRFIQSLAVILMETDKELREDLISLVEAPGMDSALDKLLQIYMETNQSVCNTTNELGKSTPHL